MQTYDNYRRGIHSKAQAVEKVTSCCGDVSYRFGLRVLTTFQGAILFILALQTNTLITKALEESRFDATQFGIIMAFVFVAIIMSYIKEAYEHRYRNEYTPVSTSTHYAHSFYQQ